MEEGTGNSTHRSDSNAPPIRKDHDAFDHRRTFGPYEVDFRTQELWKHGTRLKLSGQPFQVLELLVSRPGELVTREEFRNRLWPEDTFVDFGHGLNAAVNKLRDTLSDSADNPKYIETLPRRGYRFIAKLEGKRTQDVPVTLDPDPSASQSVAPVVVPIVSRASPAPAFVAGSRPARGKFVVLTSVAAVASIAVFAVVSVLALKYIRHSEEFSSLSGEARSAIRDATRESELQHAAEEVAAKKAVLRKAFSASRNNKAEDEAAPGLLLTNGGHPFHARTLIAGDGANSAPQFSPDGKHIAFMSSRSGPWQIWVSDADGSNQRQLSFTESAGTPRWSPDSSSVVFDAPVRGRTNVFIARVSTGEARPLAEGLVPSFSRDGKWVYFASDRSGGWQVWKVPVHGGDPIRLTSDGGFAALEFSDGYIYYAKSRLPNPEIWRVAVRGGEEEFISSRLRPRSWASWTLVATGILFAEDRPIGRPALSLFEPVNGKIHDITSLDRGPFWLGATRDGRKILMDEGDREITMLTN